MTWLGKNGNPEKHKHAALGNGSFFPRFLLFSTITNIAIRLLLLASAFHDTVPTAANGKFIRRWSGRGLSEDITPT
jgi:hypothetical protein